MSTAKKLKPRVMWCDDMQTVLSATEDMLRFSGDCPTGIPMRNRVLVLPLDDINEIAREMTKAYWAAPAEASTGESIKFALKSLGLPVVPKAKKGRT